MVDAHESTDAMNRSAARDLATRVLEAEANAIRQITLDDRFDQAVELLSRCQQDKPHGATLVVTGLGKSGLIGRKLAATFASTGTPATFMHPVEAMHGDLGMVRRHDIVLGLSNTGNTREVVDLFTLLKQDNVQTLSIVGNPDCDLTRLATCSLSYGKLEEACPNNLAPTAGTAAMLAMGDALALAVSAKRGFGQDDFGKLHPGGGLGQLLTPITEAMRFKVPTNLPLIPESATLAQAYDMAEQVARDTGLRRAGALLIINEQGQLVGVFTDGDLRRLVFANDTPSMDAVRISDVMTANPRHLTTANTVRDAVQMVREYRIDELPVIDSHNQPVGLIDVQDLVSLKVIEG